MPTIEILYLNHWRREFGVGALIITPTRELAMQIFDELRKLSHHRRQQIESGAAMLTGGGAKSLINIYPNKLFIN